MSRKEAIQIRGNLENAIVEINKFLDNHEYNREKLNELIRLVKSLDNLMVEVKYVQDIERLFGTNRYDANKQTGYYIDSDVKYDIYQKISVLRVKCKFTDLNKLDRVEDTFVRLLKFLPYCNDILIDNVMYAKKSEMLRILEKLILEFRTELLKLTNFYRDRLLVADLENALDGVVKILENEKLESDQEIKLKGFISKIDGYTPIEKLINTINQI